MRSLFTNNELKSWLTWSIPGSIHCIFVDKRVPKVSSDTWVLTDYKNEYNKEERGIRVREL